MINSLIYGRHHKSRYDVDAMEREIPGLLKTEPKSTAELIISLRRKGIETGMLYEALKRLKVPGIIDQDNTGLWRLL